jgi:hypothetical protein
MIRAVGLAVAVALAATCAWADDDEVTKIEETLSTFGCKGYESIEKEANGIYEIEDAKCEMGTMDIKLDKDYTVVLISRY